MSQSTLHVHYVGHINTHKHTVTDFVFVVQSKTSLDGLGEKSADIQPPLPPKAERQQQQQVQNQLTSSEGKTVF